jgi:hypothetical protein
MKKYLMIFLLFPILLLAQPSGECLSDCSDCISYEKRAAKINDIKFFLKKNIETDVKKPSVTKMATLSTWISKKEGKSMEEKNANYLKAINDPEFAQFLIYRRYENLENKKMSTSKTKELDDYMSIKDEILAIIDAADLYYPKRINDKTFVLPLISLSSAISINSLISCTLKDHSFLKLKLEETREDKI